jgi:hypothetical protein
MYGRFLLSFRLRVNSLKPTLLISELRINMISKNLQPATYSVLNIPSAYVKNSASDPSIYHQV